MAENWLLSADFDPMNFGGPPRPLKRFLRFEYEHRTKCGGVRDFRREFDTLEEAMKHPSDAERVQVLDLQTGDAIELDRSWPVAWSYIGYLLDYE